MQFSGTSILSVDQFNREDVENVFALAERLEPIAKRQVPCDILRGYILGNLFFEPSTRTRMSFASAFMRLGGQVNGSVGFEATSMHKGETLRDTIRAVQEFCDIIAMRHPRVGAAKEAAQLARVPVLNGGDGSGEHPTQALLDLFTMRREQGKIDGLTVGFVGDLFFGRAAHSTCKMLTAFSSIKFVCIAQEPLHMPGDIVEQARTRGMDVVQSSDFEEAIRETDVLYMTRFQEERFSDRADLRSIQPFVLTRELLEKNCKPTVTVMHPLPRLTEIAPEVDGMDKNAAYLRQPQNGLLVRMALFLLTLGKEGDLV